MPAISPVVRISLKNILVPADFSAASNAALPFALALAHVYESTVVLVHVIPAEPHETVVFDALPPECDVDREQSLAQLGDLQKRIESQDIRVKCLLYRGDLDDVITHIVRDHSVDVVVLGSHGRRGVERVLFGSHAEKIYRSAACPVLAIGPKAFSAGRWRIRRILCAIDLAEDPEPALHYALSLAEEHEAELLFVNAVPLTPWQRRPSLEQRNAESLRQLVPEDAADWCTPDYLVRWEHPAEAIICTAEDRQTDLIVMAVHRARAIGLSSHLPWPVASEVVARAPCPVMTIRV